MRERRPTRRCRKIRLTRSYPVYRPDVTITCTNPIAGTPGADPETNYQFCDRVWQAQMATVQGYPGFIRQYLTSLDNVQARRFLAIQDG